MLPFIYLITYKRFSMEKNLYEQLEIELSKANQSCWVIRQIIAYSGESDEQLNQMLSLERDRFTASMNEVQRLYSDLQNIF